MTHDEKRETHTIGIPNSHLPCKRHEEYANCPICGGELAMCKECGAGERLLWEYSCEEYQEKARQNA